MPKPFSSQYGDPLEYVAPFGKHRGKTLWWIAQNDPAYLDWATDLKTNSSHTVAMRQNVLEFRGMACKAVQIPEVARLIDAALEGS